MQELPGGLADLTVDGQVHIYAGDVSKEILGVDGRISFRIGGAEGFRLQDVQLNGITLFGQTIPFPNLQPPVADLSKPLDNGVVLTTDLTFIDVTFRKTAGQTLQGIDGNELKLEQGTNTYTFSAPTLQAALSTDTAQVYRYALPAGFVVAPGESTVEFVKTPGQSKASPLAHARPLSISRFSRRLPRATRSEPRPARGS